MAQEAFMSDPPEIGGGVATRKRAARLKAYVKTAATYPRPAIASAEVQGV
jgi:hypothetical protein